jgi:predicted AAA+ superfamily ATPase
VPASDAQRLWIRGGFPEPLLAADDGASLRWRQQFIATYLERDIPQLGPRIPAETLRRFWTMLAHEQSQFRTQAYFYRNSAGAEIDLVLELPKRQRWAIEIKRSSAPSVSKGFHIAAADLQATSKFVVHAGADSSPLGNQTQEVTLLELQRTLATPSRAA